MKKTARLDIGFMAILAGLIVVGFSDSGRRLPMLYVGLLLCLLGGLAMITV